MVIKSLVKKPLAVKAVDVELVRAKVLGIIESMGTVCLEMEPVIWAMWTAILAGDRMSSGELVGEHCLFMGPPGIGKTHTVNKLVQCIEMAAGDYFYKQFGKFTIPSSVMGVPDKKAYMEENVFRMIRDGYLPRAYFALLDEIWNAGPCTDDLNEILNERVFKDGAEIVKCNLVSAFATSNQYASDAHSAATFDRFLVRFWLTGELTDASWEKMDAIGRELWHHPTISIPELRGLKEAAAKVEIPAKVAKILRKIHQELKSGLGIVLSNRRIKKWNGLVRANACLHGRTIAILEDVRAIVPAAWLRHETLPQVQDCVNKAVNTELSRWTTQFDLCHAAHAQATLLIEEYKKTADVEPDPKKLAGIAVLAEALSGALDLFDAERRAGTISPENQIEFDGYLNKIFDWHKAVKDYAALARRAGVNTAASSSF